MEGHRVPRQVRARRCRRLHLRTNRWHWPQLRRFHFRHFRGLLQRGDLRLLQRP